MIKARASEPTVHELQAMAAEAARPRRRRRPYRPSRAARLHLIDMLSRWAGAGLALIAGLGVFVAMSAGRAYPMRAALWLLVVLAALYVCRRQLKDFRSGERAAAHPFRWRADYTAAVATLSAAFGAGALVVLPPGAPMGLAIETMGLLFAGALGAALLHAPHGRSGAALWLPTSAFCFLGAWRAGGADLALFGALAMTLAGAAALFLLNRTLRRDAVRRFPRTGLVRRSADEQGAGYDDESATAAAI